MYISCILAIIFICLQASVQTFDNKKATLQSKVVKVTKGQDFSYICCANVKDTIIRFRWGLYMKGSQREPIPLYSRVTIKEEMQIHNMWSKDFNASRYFKRVRISYDPTTLCMTWQISPVRYGDENTFYAVFRDDTGIGKQFNPCNVTAKLLVLKSTLAPPRSSSQTPSYLDLVSPPTKEAEHVTHKTTTSDIYTKESPVSSADSSSVSSVDWRYIVIPVIALVILVFGIVSTLLYCKRKEPSVVREGRLWPWQAMRRKSKKEQRKLRRRKPTRNKSTSKV